MNKTKIIGLSLLLALTFFPNCFAQTELQELKIHEEDRTISIENKEEYVNKIENEIIINGVKYELKDMQEQENKITVTRDKQIKEKQIVKISDKYNVLRLFEDKKQVEEDGYTGILELQPDSLDLQINDSYTEQYKVTLKKEYNNVSKNELNNIPKIIEKNGTIYYLINPVWNIAQTQKIDGQDIPTQYNCIMNYEGVKERKVIKNYIATVSYKGTLKKEETDSITYHLIYEEIPIEEKVNDYTPVIVTTGGIIFLSGIIILKRKNVFVYNYKDNKWKLVKKLHLSKKDNQIDISSILATNSKYKIVLNNRLYHELLHKNVTIKYFDKQYIYEIRHREFEINV